MKKLLILMACIAGGMYVTSCNESESESVDFGDMQLDSMVIYNADDAVVKKYQYGYDEHGNCAYIFRLQPYDGKLRDDYMIMYSYDDEGYRDESRYIIVDEKGDGHSDYYTFYDYIRNDKGEIIAIDCKTTFTGPVSLASRKDRYAYDNLGDISFIERYYEQEDGWAIASKREYFYASNGQLTCILYSESGNLSWYQYRKDEFSYNRKGFLTTVKTQYAAWNETKSEFTTKDGTHPDSRRDYTLLDDKWQLTGYTKYYYSSHPKTNTTVIPSNKTVDPFFEE